MIVWFLVSPSDQQSKSHARPPRINDRSRDWSGAEPENGSTVRSTIPGAARTCARTCARIVQVVEYRLAPR